MFEGDPSLGELRLNVDTALYSEEAVFRTCYLFTDRCYLFLEPAGASAITVHLRKKKSSPVMLDAVAGDFANELINQKLRAQLSAETKTVRELIVARAFREADL